jgi:nucleoporin POM152
MPSRYLRFVFFLQGAPPYSVAYQILGEEPRVISGISSSYATLDIAIPQKYIEKGGSFIVTLISIKDGNGCLRNLTVSDLNIEVHRTKPTLKFYGSENERKIIAREGDMAALPMRLTGNGVSLNILSAPSRPREKKKLC